METPEATNENPEVQLSADGSTATVSTDPTPAEPQGEELLAGKFKSQDDLIKAYKELESKLGQQQPQQPGQQQTEEQTDTGEESEDKTEAKDGDEGDTDPLVEIYGEAVGNALKEAEVDAAEVQQQFDETGTISDENFAKFEKAGFPRGMVEAYMRGLAQANEQAVAITEQQISQIKAVAGGDEGYQQMQEWMGANLSQEELQAFNDTVDTGDYTKVLAAVSEMNRRYLTEVGVEGNLRGGKAPAQSEGYANEAEYLADMAKPEYKTSEAFRNQVMQKLAKSPNVFITR